MEAWRAYRCQWRSALSNVARSRGGIVEWLDWREEPSVTDPRIVVPGQLTLETAVEFGCLLDTSVPVASAYVFDFSRMAFIEPRSGRGPHLTRWPTGRTRPDGPIGGCAQRAPARSRSAREPAARLLHFHARRQVRTIRGTTAFGTAPRGTSRSSTGLSARRCPS